MTPWWRQSVLYEVYVRSFADANGDGVGDLDGIRSHLRHLADLGVDGLWITPFYPSPMADGGYDVADQRDVDPLFGDLTAFDALLADAHGLGLKLMVDVVPNHSSDRHPAFQAALASPPGSPERDMYLFRDGQGVDGDQPPNDWQSVFGGPAWTRVPDGQWYLHLFAPEQPDWNWRNPAVAADYETTLRFWLDRGVDGFRIDVAHGLLKDVLLRDNPPLPSGATEAGAAFRTEEEPHIWDQDEVHEVYRRWRKIMDSYVAKDGVERAFVAEAWVPAGERLARYVRGDELHLAFAFSLLGAEWSAKAWRGAIDEVLSSSQDVGAPATWVIGNHDVTRPVTRYGGGAAGLRRARAATLTLLALPGTVFLYQGDELGLPEVSVAPADRQDPTWERSGHTNPGRDGCRVPLPWSGSATPFGFSPDGVQPWLPQPADWSSLTVAAETGAADSMLTLVRGALSRRREVLFGGLGALVWRELPDAPGCLAFDRISSDASGRVTIVANAGPEAASVAGVGREVVASSGPVTFSAGTLTLPPDTAAWLAH